jgi:hypothetical protein
MFQTIFYVVFTVPGQDVRVFGSKVKTVMFLSRFGRRFTAARVYTGTPDLTTGTPAEDCTQEIMQLIDKVMNSSTIQLNGRDELDPDYRPQNDPYYNKVKRICRR